jgi:hypothetical protein
MYTALMLDAPERNKQVKRVDITSPVFQDLLTDMHNVLREAKRDYATIKSDARTLFDLLSPKLIATRPSLQAEFKFDDLTAEDLLTDKVTPQVFYVFGNNDIRVLDQVAITYQKLKKINKAPTLIIISGDGGHATVTGHIFGLTEAETMKNRLIELLIPPGIIRIDPKATNTTENIVNSEAILNESSASYHHVMIFSTMSTLYRQFSSMVEQSKYEWRSISVMAPDWEYAKRHYFSNNKDILINFIYMLREVVTFLHYSINRNLAPKIEYFMSSRVIPSQEKLSAAIHLVVKYQEIFASYHHKEKIKKHAYIKQECIKVLPVSPISTVNNDRPPSLIMSYFDSPIDAHELSAQFFEALIQKNNGALSPILQKQLHFPVKQFFEYFRCMFDILEKLYIPQIKTELKQKKSLVDVLDCLVSHKVTRQQSEILDPHKTGARFGLERLLSIFPVINEEKLAASICSPTSAPMSPAKRQPGSPST